MQSRIGLHGKPYGTCVRDGVYDVYGVYYRKNHFLCMSRTALHRFAWSTDEFRLLSFMFILPESERLVTETHEKICLTIKLLHYQLNLFMTGFRRIWASNLIQFKRTFVRDCWHERFKTSLLLVYLVLVLAILGARWFTDPENRTKPI